MTDATTDRQRTSSDIEQHSSHWKPNCADGQLLADRYALRSILSRSSFGMTWLAQNVYLPGQPLCVIKQLAPQFTDPQLVAIARTRFELEAVSLSRLGTHAQIPSLLDYFQIGTDLYLVTEYIPGSVLPQIIAKQGRFTEPEIENFLEQMLALLEYIHSQHTIHCDIKPQNIILCQTDRRFVLIDFGAAADLDPATSDRLDTSSVAVGTPGYAPPEQLANRAVYASDLYALGMTCVYLLTGREPRHLPIDQRTCELMWSEDVDISPDLGEIVSKLIQVPLTERYSCVSQVVTALENRAVRAKLRTYLDQKHAISKTDRIDGNPYPAVVHWALEIK
ncbi:serine/threonine-protein kinase [Chamaesiphon sp. OTE_20_metabat_361]|uniref:serine/threonine-protein kinase n=1 Tax=Chamaesiphon sp. OTE_20_metabat_361 TaxID=2964689 RepID=UPI00286B82A3|nr:serine/threonine-protein kinase [Chamaesiphon sp. OTE_20_metabat_361]